MEYAGLKIKRPPQAVLRPRRRLNVCCAVDCAAGGRGDCESYPGSIFPYLGEAPAPLCFTIQNRVFISGDTHLYLIVLIHVKRKRYSFCLCTSEYFVVGSDRYDGVCQIARIA